ncbi:MAG: hypothetical protein ACE5J3_14845, partial [Methanosarcinales archaeon]
SADGYSSGNKTELPTIGAVGNSIAGGEIISANSALGTTTLSYFKSASITSEKIQPSLLGNWNKFYANDTLPKGTNIIYKILKASDNSTLCIITSAEANIGYDLSKCATNVSAIRLYAKLTTNNNYATPRLHYWKVSWTSENIVVSISNASIAPSNYIRIPIKIYNVSKVDSSGLSYAKINLYYDYRVVNVTNVANGRNGFSMFSAIDDDVGKVTMIGTGIIPVTGKDIEFANITFKGENLGVSELGIVVEQIENKTGANLLPVEVSNGTFTVEYHPPTIHIYTDKVNYTAGEVQYLGLELANPDLASSGPKYYFLLDQQKTLPADFQNELPEFQNFTLPSLPSGKYIWWARLLDPRTGRELYEDTAEWNLTIA